jgi:hypothetical protein
VLSLSEAELSSPSVVALLGKVYSLRLHLQVPSPPWASQFQAPERVIMREIGIITVTGMINEQTELDV